MSLTFHYQQMIADGKLNCDHAQRDAITALAQLSKDLTTAKLGLKRLTTKLKSSPHQGIYLYGRVGRGKTMMMDLFYCQLNIERKQRMHFHHFIEQVHQQLKQLTGQANPLKIIAKNWAKKVDVLCFDEFFVNDIADAMLLGGLFEQLFKYNLVLITTSNCKPEQLYRNGLQRQRFLPTIDLLNQYCRVISVNGDTDHRIHQQLYGCYVYPHTQFANFISNKFQQISDQSPQSGQLMINHRLLSYLGKSDKDRLIYFDYKALCTGPRSQRDYMAIANDFDTVLIANVPQFAGALVKAIVHGIEDSYQRDGQMLVDLNAMDDQARRFIALIDEFYDRRIKVYISAEVDIFSLYQGKQLAFEFARCESRLIEMQNSNYQP